MVTLWDFVHRLKCYFSLHIRTQGLIIGLKGFTESKSRSAFFQGIKTKLNHFCVLVKCSRDSTAFRLEKLQKALKDGDAKAVAAIILTKNKVSCYAICGTQ